MAYRTLMSLIVASPACVQPEALTTIKQPAFAVSVDVKAEIEVKMNVEIRNSIEIPRILKALVKNVGVWLCAVRYSSVHMGGRNFQNVRKIHTVYNRRT